MTQKDHLRKMSSCEEVLESHDVSSHLPESARYFNKKISTMRGSYLKERLSKRN